MSKVVVYTRVSTENQEVEGGRLGFLDDVPEVRQQGKVLDQCSLLFLRGCQESGIIRAGKGLRWPHL